MKKTILACLFLLLACLGAAHAQSQLQPVEGPLPGLQGRLNQATTIQGTVILSGNDVLVQDLQGETFRLVNGFGLLQGNQIVVGELIWVTKANDYNTTRSNKEKG